MKKGLLNEIKAMNKIAGTQLTKEQEISLIKNVLNEAASSKAAKLLKLEDRWEKLTTELEKVEDELDQLRLDVAREITVTKQGKKTIYKRNSDGIEWYKLGPNSSFFWKIDDKFTDKKVKHDDPEFDFSKELFTPQTNKIAMALYNGPIPKK